MPKSVTQYDLLISCPGDIKEEINAIERSVHKFNEMFGSTLNIAIRTRHWSKSSFAQSGDKPQNLLNKQFVDDCDAAVALFWTRFGTPTDEYGSGTEEEIMKMLAEGKQVFMYFSDAPLPPSTIQSNQYQHIIDFKSRYKDKGLYFCYNSVDDFEQMFFAHLSEYFLSLKRVSEIQSEKKSMLKIQSINYDGNLDDKLILQDFVLKHKSTKDYLSEVENNIERINGIHIPKLNESSIAYKLLVGSKVNINYRNREVIESYAKQRNIKLADDFFDFGNLRKGITPTILGGNDINGTDDEETKYNLFNATAKLIYDCYFWSKIEDTIKGLTCINLVLSNYGTSFDEDVEISLFVPNANYVELDTLFNWDNDVMGFILNNCSINTLFGIDKTSEYLDYNSSIQSPRHSPYIKTLPLINSDPDYSEEFYSEIQNTFSYDVFQQEHDTVIKIKFDYIKQHTAVAYPSVIFVSKDLKSIEYRITSKNYPDIINGIIKI